MPNLDRAAIRARLDGADKGRWANFIAHAPTDLAALLDENERLRKALEFYAEPWNWSRTAFDEFKGKGTEEAPSLVERDKGKRATNALAGREGV